MILLLKLALFLLSMGGWCLYATHRAGLRAELAPFVVLSGMGAVLYPAGLLNLYAPVEWAIWLGGLVLLAAYLLRRREALEPWMRGRTLVLALAGGWMLWLMRGAVLFGHDNMSHWGIMVKTMVRFGRLPNTQNAAVEFVGYPPGTSGFIKYFCDFVGVSDGMMMFAQGLLLLAGVFALLVFCPPERGRRWGLGLWAAAAVFLLTGDLTPADLRVDTLLAVLALGSLAVIAYYGPHDPQKAAWASMSGLMLLALTKNSGLFFVAADLVVLSWFLLRRRDRKMVPALAAAWGVPLVSFWLWLRHVDLVFPQGDSSKHAVSVSGYESIFGGKTPEDMHTFNGMFARHLVDLSNPDTRCMWLLLALVIAGALWLWLSGALGGKHALLLGGGLILGELLYVGCLWCTYAFSMTSSEMLCLASIQRYHLTGILYFTGALVIALLWALGRTHVSTARAVAGVLSTVLFAAMVLLGQPGQTEALICRAPYRNTGTQGELLQLRQELGLEEGKRYLFYTRGDPQVDTWSMRYVARYVLNTDTVDFWQFPEQDFGYEDLYGTYDYLVLYAPDADSRAFLEEGFFDPDSRVLELIQ